MPTDEERSKYISEQQAKLVQSELEAVAQGREAARQNMVRDPISGELVPYMSRPGSRAYDIATDREHLPPGRPSDVEFERELVSKGLTAPRVTPAGIEAIIVGEYYFTAAQGANATIEGGVEWSRHKQQLSLLTFCVLVLRNGFLVTGESACASPENFNAEAGRKAARNNAIGKVWPLEGYLLRQMLHEASFDQLKQGEL